MLRTSCALCVSNAKFIFPMIGSFQLEIIIKLRSWHYILSFPNTKRQWTKRVTKGFG